MAPDRESAEEAQRELRRSAKQAHAVQVTTLVGHLLGCLAGFSESVIRDSLTMVASTHNLRVVSAERPLAPNQVRAAPKDKVVGKSTAPPPAPRNPEINRLEAERKGLANALSSGGPSSLLSQIHRIDSQIKALKVISRSGNLKASDTPPIGEVSPSAWYAKSGVLDGISVPPPDQELGNGERPLAGDTRPMAQSGTARKFSVRDPSGSPSLGLLGTQ